MRIFRIFKIPTFSKYSLRSYMCSANSCAHTHRHTPTQLLHVGVSVWIDQFLLKCKKIRRFSFAVAVAVVVAVVIVVVAHILLKWYKIPTICIWLLWKKVTMRSEMAALMQEIAVLIVLVVVVIIFYTSCWLLINFIS